MRNSHRTHLDRQSEPENSSQDKMAIAFVRETMPLLLPRQRNARKDPWRLQGVSTADERGLGGQTSDRQTLLLCLLLFSAVLVSYSSVIHNQFLDYDDDRYITENPSVKAA